MRFQQALFIDGKEYPIIHTNVSLELSSIGRAVFDIRTEAEPPKGIIYYDCGYTDAAYYRYFIGVVREVVRRDTKSFTIHCREVSLSLLLECPLSLRNCTLYDVIREISQATKLEIGTEQTDYSTKLVPRFANTGNALHAIRLIPTVFGIGDFIWYQNKQGKLWLGNYPDSEWAKKQSVEIPDKFFTKQQASHMATLPVMPAIRPGAIINNKRLSHVQLEENEVHLQWSS